MVFLVRCSVLFPWWREVRWALSSCPRDIPEVPWRGSGGRGPVRAASTRGGEGVWPPQCQAGGGVTGGLVMVILIWSETSQGQCDWKKGWEKPEATWWTWNVVKKNNCLFEKMKRIEFSKKCCALKSLNSAFILHLQTQLLWLIPPNS